MGRLTLSVLVGLALLALAAPAQGIEVMVTTTPAAPFCCGLANLSFSSTINISNPEPAFFEQPYEWEVWNGVFNCYPYSTRFSPLGTPFSGRNIGFGVLQIFYQNYGSQPCDIAARSYTFASVGGYGLLPYVATGYTSFCHEPCTCP